MFFNFFEVLGIESFDSGIVNVIEDSNHTEVQPKVAG
jgi:hypothetical protein